jgi:hypothetical protein
VGPKPVDDVRADEARRAGNDDFHAAVSGAR